ncbi:iron chelate uptake ABC transporter family permease subunit [soil metagenome]
MVVLLLAAVMLVSGAGLAIGAYVVSVPDLLAALAGLGAPKDEFIVLQLRLPRVLLGMLAGLALALAGGLFQSLLGNPLASPDIIGISGGASAGAVSALLLWGATGAAVSLSAFVGALLVAVAIYALSWRAGLTGYRFVLVGVAFAFLVQGLLGYLLTRADVRDAQGALVWLVGSLGGARREEIAVLAGSLALLLPLVAALVPRLRILQLGDATAAGLGVRVRTTRGALLAAAVALTAVATAAVGPIAFVAFASAPIARRVVGGLALVPTALVGMLLVVTADLVGQHLLPRDIQVPVGIITGAVGAPYLLWLLATSARRGETG